MTDPAHPLATFLRAAAHRLVARNVPQAALLTQLPPTVPILPSAQCPACAVLSDLMTGSDPLLDALAPCLPHLHWKAPGFGKLPASVADHMAVVELAGPLGMIPDARIRLGLLIQGAHLSYPAHQHAAAEVYLLLAGAADWSRDSSPFQPKTAGDLIHHAPMQPHAMRTGPQPMLALWLWHGDISSDTYRL